MRKLSVFVLVLFILAMATAAFCQKADTEQKPQQIMPKKIGVDTNFNGKPDRWEYYDDKGQITKVESDPDEDGIIDETVVYENGKPVKGWKDTNKDGKPDVWIDF